MSEERDQKSSTGHSVSRGTEKTNSQPDPAEDSKEPLAGQTKRLTAAEQMALYEEKLKEEDWGHQPC